MPLTTKKLAKNRAKCELRPQTRLAFIRAIRLQAIYSEEAGISLPIALLIFFVVLLVAVSLANFTTSGLFAVSSQTDNREARGSAESGMAEIVAELNKEPNRRLLVAGNTRYTSSAGWDISSSGGLYNDCASLNSAGNVTAPLVAPTFNLAPGIANARRLRGETSDRRRYYIEQIQYLAQDSTGQRSLYNLPSENTLSGVNKSFIRITVVGLSSNGGKLSKSRIAREFEIVPKCCKRSFGNNLINATGYGNDKLGCLNDSRGGSGLIVGLNNGRFSGSGNTFDIKNDLGTPITQARCWSGNEAGTVDSTNTTCTGGSLTIGSSISAAPTDFDYVIPGPLPSTSLTANNEVACSNTSGNICIDQGNGPSRVIRNYIRLKADNTTVEACKISGNALDDCKDLKDWGATCQVDNNLPAAPSAYCRVARINLNGANLKIDSSRGDINFYFDNPSCDSVLSTSGAAVSGTTYVDGGVTTNCSTTAPSAHNFLDGSNGNGTITHVYCNNSPSICNTAATLSTSNRLNFYVVDQGYLKMKGATSAVALNIFAPFATVGWAGGGNQNPNYLGRIWAHNLDLQGSISMIVERSNPGTCTASTCPEEVGGLIDHKVRNYTQSSGF